MVATPMRRPLMTTQDIPKERTPHRFGMREVVIMNLLPLVPAFIGGGLLGIGCAGIPLAATLVVDYGFPYWIMVVPLCCLALVLAISLFVPGLMCANYYVRHLVSHLRSDHKGMSCICQMTTQPRICRGARAFLEDADDVGVLSIQPGVLTFRGDHSDLVVDLSNSVAVELHNIGWRGLWYASRRVRLILPEQERIHAVDIVERQCWSVFQSRRLMLEIVESIKSSGQRCPVSRA